MNTKMLAYNSRKTILSAGETSFDSNYHMGVCILHSAESKKCVGKLKNSRIN